MQSVFNGIYSKHFAELYRYARWATGNDVYAEEIVQEVFLSLWQTMQTIQILNYGGWLQRTLQNKLKEHYRSSKRKGMYRTIETATRREMIPNAILMAEAEREITAILLALKEKKRRIIFYIDIEKIGYEKTSKRLSMSVRTLSRERKKIWRTIFRKLKHLNFPPQILERVPMNIGKGYNE